MITVVLIHGLAASTDQWRPLLQYLEDVNVLNFEFPGHGQSKSINFDWESTVTELRSQLPKSGCVIYVLHSFAASFLPDIVNLTKRTDRIILLEGIVHVDDAKWTHSVPFRDAALFKNWTKKFKLGRKVALKSQLINYHDKSDVDLWSAGFVEVNPNALKTYSINLINRLRASEVLNTLKNNSDILIYIKGSKSKLSKPCLDAIRECNIRLYTITNAAHFPMLDNPKAVYNIVKSIINEVSCLAHHQVSKLSD